jgi:hypothetical protein
MGGRAPPPATFGGGVQPPPKDFWGGFRATPNPWGRPRPPRQVARGGLRATLNNTPTSGWGWHAATRLPPLYFIYIFKN